MKFFKVAALAAMVVSGSALAAPFHQYGEDSSLKIYQYGTSNHANALQSDAYHSTTEIKQRGGNHNAETGQGSDNSYIKLTQNGYAQNASIDQWGGSDSGVTVTQDGFHNNATVNQWSSRNSATTVDQDGHFNNATVNQTASSSQVYVTQVGAFNSASASQY